jgi:regulator of telomere elongation helicase 1
LDHIIDFVVLAQVCPYYLARDNTNNAQLVLVPYNYLIDADSRASIGIRWANSVVIFDEV